MGYKCETHELPAQMHVDPETGRVLMTCSECVKEQAKRIPWEPPPTRWTTKPGLVAPPDPRGRR